MIETFVAVLIRTHKRPKKLRQCLDSLNKQGKKNFVVILISDYQEDNIDQITVEYPDLEFIIKHIDKPEKYPYCGKYFNQIKDLFKSKYVVFIDDDDEVCDEQYFSDIQKIYEMENEPAVIMSKTNLNGLGIIPDPPYWKKLPSRCHVSTLNFCVSFDIYKKFSWWSKDYDGCPDFFYIKEIFDSMDWEKKVYWLDKVTTKSINYPGLGREEM